MYEFNKEKQVYQTDLYVVDYGKYPGEELDVYRAFNRNTGVMEYAHSTLFYIMQWAQMGTKAVQDLENSPEGTSVEDIELPVALS